MFRAFLVWGMLLLNLSAFSQILDDSTKQIYGPSTVYYLNEEDLDLNIDRKRSIDTLVQKFQYFGPLEPFFNGNLGNYATASENWEKLNPYALEQTTGFNVFDTYLQDPVKIKYYNTHSPFTDIRYQQTGFGYIYLGFTHTQNIKPNLNIGLDINKYNAIKQFGRVSSTEKLVNHWDYNVNVNYQSKNKKYNFLTAFYYANHKQEEQGGAKNSNGSVVNPDSVAFNYATQFDATLENGVVNKVQQLGFHTYQQLSVLNGLKFYLNLNLEKRINWTRDPNFATHIVSDLYHLSELGGFKQDDTLSKIADVSVKRSLATQDLKNGVKGRLKGFDYNLFFRFRNNDFTVDTTQSFQSIQLFLGGQMGYYLKDETSYLILYSQFGINGDDLSFNLGSKLATKLFTARAEIDRFTLPYYYKMDQSAIYLQKREKSKKLNAPERLLIEVQTKFQSPKWRIWPKFIFQNFSNYWYIDKSQQITYTKDIQAFQIGGDVSFFLNKWAFSSRLLYSFLTENQDDSPIRIPAIQQNLNIDYKLRYAKKIDIHTGLDIDFFSSYKPTAYSPLFQKFYLQDQLKINSKTVLSPYVAFVLGRVKMAVNYYYINKLWEKSKGYLVRPNYLGTNAYLGIKIYWPMFD